MFASSFYGDIYRKGVIHSMVEFNDGTIKAISETPDMKNPIEYALFHPDKGNGVVPSIDLSKLEKISFLLQTQKNSLALKLRKTLSNLTELLPQL